MGLISRVSSRTYRDLIMSVWKNFDYKPYRYVPKDPNRKTNEIHNEVREFNDSHPRKAKKRDIQVLHRKGTWSNPNNIQILREKSVKFPTKLDWLNKDNMEPLDQQRTVLNRLMANPSQSIILRTEKHATKDLKLWQPRVFRNEGGNLMSSIAGAGCNKFHEFRQIRRNDRDRDLHFEY